MMAEATPIVRASPNQGHHYGNTERILSILIHEHGVVGKHTVKSKRHIES